MSVFLMIISVYNNPYLSTLYVVAPTISYQVFTNAHAQVADSLLENIFDYEK